MNYTTFWQTYSLALPAAWLIVIILSYTIQNIIAFITDTKVSYLWVNKFVMTRLLNCKYISDHEYSHYRKKNGNVSDGTDGIIIMLLLLALFPSVIVVVMKFTLPLIIISGCVLMMFLARFTCRLHKKLSEHIDDS
jgi:hypothetical protein